MTLQLERVLFKPLRAFASYSWDNSISNLSFDQYEANVILGGVKATSDS